MDLSFCLKEPIVLPDVRAVGQVSERLRAEEHPYVFIEREGQYYAVKTYSLVLGLQQPNGEADTGLAPGSTVRVLPLTEVIARVLDVLAEEVTLVQHGGRLFYILREDVLMTMVSNPDSEIAWLRSLFASIPRGLMMVDLGYTVVNSNREAQRMLRVSERDLQTVRLQDWFGLRRFQHVQSTFTPLLNQVITLPNGLTVLVDFVPLVTDRVITGFALVLQDLPSVETMAMELDAVKQLNQDLEAILSTIYDEIVVLDVNGTLLRASTHFIAARWRRPPHEFIGQRIVSMPDCNDLLRQVFFEVKKKKRKVSVLQNEGDAPCLAVGNPIFYRNDQLDRVVIASRDLTEVSRLEQELEKTRRQNESYRQALLKLPERASHGHGTPPVYVSFAMHNVMQEVERVAPFSVTVLLTGESGVGKEVIANAIHSLSDRRDMPFVKINCAAIPETLLESELFGYEQGAFSGASRQGKQGLFIKADKGTLFLDEISELPLSMQSKILRAIQEQEVYLVGGTKPIRFDVRIIAATNRSLPELVAKGTFREDLFYRLNVFPIDIPPLRDRREDIAVLANHFLFQFNQTYGRNLRLSSLAMEVLEAYDWPGNVRELQNLIQRVAIKNNGDVIESAAVEEALMKRDASLAKRPQRFTQVVPLKQALQQVEEELITLAMKTYGSTTRAAQALGISQSSVSRKYSRIINHTRGSRSSRSPV
jgi:transcriptional regulator with PAS, ATPase and Fis domain